MAINLPPVGELLSVPGVEVGTANAGIKQTERDDVVVVRVPSTATVAGVFTRNGFRAAPVQIAAERIAGGGIRALVINSGNANAATGQPGKDDALQVCAGVARELELNAGAVLPFSTGVIGERLPVPKMLAAVATACAEIGPGNWEAAARAIMTTDTQPKVVSRRVVVEGEPVTITGMAKGAGMIKPDMATMLAFICCDARISRECLAVLTREVADRSFNRITIDGDTSTNDSFVICATGIAENRGLESPAGCGYGELKRAIGEVAVDLARRVVRDGEGATKFVTVRVCAGADSAECLAVAYTVAESPLVKTALFAGDPNWGRFCMAIGRAGIADLDTGRVNLYLNNVQIAAAGLVAPGYQEAQAAAVMAGDEFEVRIELGRGDSEEEIWTTDLSYEYIRINAEYRT